MHLKLSLALALSTLLLTASEFSIAAANDPCIAQEKPDPSKNCTCTFPQDKYLPVCLSGS